jgi:hypothetical protein
MTESMLALEPCVDTSVNGGRGFRAGDGFLPEGVVAGKTVNISRRDGLVFDSVRVAGFEAARGGTPGLTAEGGEYGPADAYRGEDTMPLAGPAKVALWDAAPCRIYAEGTKAGQLTRLGPAPAKG